MMGCRGEALTRAITVDRTEIEEALWVTREEVMAMLAGTHPAIRPPRLGAIAGFLMRMWVADRLD